MSLCSFANLCRPVTVVIGTEVFESMELPAECTTIGEWKELMGSGEWYPGGRIQYVEKLVCLGEGSGFSGQQLPDSAPLPGPPSRLCVRGPHCIVKMVNVALSSQRRPGYMPKFGSFRCLEIIGQGNEGMGARVWCAEHVETREPAAVKWPASDGEFRALSALGARETRHVVPKLLDSGLCHGQRYVVLERLGADLFQVFDELGEECVEEATFVLRLLGRMLVRRLHAVHERGFVHCDISPTNILFSEDRDGPLLVDFGLAQKWPGSQPMAGDIGSIEWSSIRSGNGWERRPLDDLEAVGWVLLCGLYDSLPWFTPLQEAYGGEWGSAQCRAAAVRQAQQQKRQLLQHGWQSFGPPYCRNVPLPQDFRNFLRQCQVDGPCQSVARGPDYEQLCVLLGGRDGELGTRQAEAEDVQLCRKHISPLVARGAGRQGRSPGTGTWWACKT